MKRRSSWVLSGALALAACNSDAPSTPAPSIENESAEPPAPEVPVMGAERPILAFGDSLFAGYGLNDGESYPAKLELALRAKGIDARIANAGVSGDTSAAALQRLKFTLDNQQPAPDLAIVELGGNDLLRGLSPKETKANIAAILTELKARKIPAMLMGMRAPPNAGAQFQGQFDALYPALAKEYGVPLVPFFLEAIYDKPDLLQQDHIHPTAHGVEELVSATVDQVDKALPKAEK
ncbi:MAG: arylesterase [Candidatus Andeanibacterium colombiense]|uniref:Arylesterase n=1 Tax=Candidatus Andeanibacterium colombiense TaxID=3121345 RepID=A0AAJ6BMM2_9SPHN|nr:MAG: arylesterase [Sphingomonadaceae bacterium]